MLPIKPLGIPELNQVAFEPAGIIQPATAGVTVKAMNKDQNNITTNAIAMEPTKSPAGPGNKIIGVKASAVVAVEANKGAARRLTD